MTDARLKDVTRSGPGRLLIAVYGIFVIAATARSAVQIASHFGKAPLAYLLSALAAVIYIVALVCLVKGSRAARRIAMISCAVELVGVVVVGTVSLFAPQLFPDATVWSFYGRGYGFVPVVLPILGLWWIRATARHEAAG
nr:putative integral membrane protein [Kibdelosporangium sp. MJ126-NF4]